MGHHSSGKYRRNKHDRYQSEDSLFGFLGASSDRYARDGSHGGGKHGGGRDERRSHDDAYADRGSHGGGYADRGRYDRGGHAGGYTDDYRGHGKKRRRSGSFLNRLIFD